MSGPITWESVAQLVTLAGALIAFGMLLARVNRLVADQAGDREDFKALRADVQETLRTLAEHSVQIKGILEHQNGREREYLALLREHFGVGNTRGSPDDEP